MRSILLFAALIACAGDDPIDTDVDTDTSVDTDTDTDTDTQAEPAVDLEGWWQVPPLTALPGQADPYWCDGAEPGDYSDERWLELDEPATCWDDTSGGCINDLEFHQDGTITRHVRFAADGPCPFDGVTRSVIANEPWGRWSLVSTDGETDTYSINGMTWTVSELGDGSTIIVEGEGKTASLSDGRSQWFD